ncbi:MAG: hypothetical protein AAGA10_13510, partial [Bacteroidota bacterium]
MPIRPNSLCLSVSAFNLPKSHKGVPHPQSTYKAQATPPNTLLPRRRNHYMSAMRSRKHNPRLP